MEVTFRVAEEADIEHILSFISDFYKFGHLPFNYTIARVALEKLLKDNTLGYVWLIYSDQVPIGYIILTLGYSLEYHGRDAFIDELYIEASHRRRGIGTQALKFIEQFCRTIGVNALHLEVDRDDLGAQAFYRNASFKDHDRYLITKWIQ